ncbi:hypothetical protein AWJ20_614 [Sugiyamaella lignohabitans]|uniref:DH domain-containing protein n=1 Tax=Sugiyamaella lignohabitans TaxID=796027 RepID=A0A167D1G0_9ASCO|nr:uncharacterized protein AWJ20_614 [Sugiyamaella lignohabitans]ANB12363.1 hypothetical protein AWJ20_614 [Sugiyamaella lignohabitans]
MDTFYRLRSMACPNLDAWLTECFDASKTITTAWTLDSLLIKPVQRLLKYPLLMDSLLKATNEGHPDYASLEMAAEQMRKCADHINSDKSDDTEVSLSKKALRQKEFEEESANLRQLKTTPTADVGLQQLLSNFYQKRRNIRSLIQSIATNSADIQHQFNSNSALAKAWLTWSMAIGIDEEDSSKMRRYKHYALFSTPFTSTSSTQLSTAKLSRKIEKEVLVPLEKVWAMYERTELLAADRLRFHVFYAKYVASKSDLPYVVSPTSTGEHHSFSALDRQRADLFFKYHNSLKDGLPDLFRLTDRMVECCFAKYIEIQRQWFRMTVDSMATVFNLKVNDIQDAEGRLDHDPIVAKFRETEAIRNKALELGICRESFYGGDDVALSNSSTSDSESTSDAQDRLSLAPMLSTVTVSSSKERLKIHRKSSILSLTNWQRTLKSNPSKFLSGAGN